MHEFGKLQFSYENWNHIFSLSLAWSIEYVCLEYTRGAEDNEKTKPSKWTWRISQVRMKQKYRFVLVLQKTVLEIMKSNLSFLDPNLLNSFIWRTMCITTTKLQWGIINCWFLIVDLRSLISNYCDAGNVYKWKILFKVAF